MKAFFFSIIYVWSITSTAQLTYIPDNAFEQYLETEQAIYGFSNGVPNDNFVNTAAVDICAMIDIDGNLYPIQNLSGIENFSALKAIYLQNVLLTSLDLTNVTSNPYAIQIKFSPLLTQLMLPHSDSWNLVSIVGNNSLVSMEFAPNSKFSTAQLGTQITLEITNNGSLLSLDISNVQIINTGFLYVISNPSLQCLNIQNGATALWTYAQILGNDVLSCVQVDNPLFCENSSWLWSNSTTPDPATSFYSTNCASCIANVSENHRESWIVSPNPTKGFFTVNTDKNLSGSSYHIYDQYGRLVKNGVLNGQQNEIHITEGSGLYFLKIGNEVSKVQVTN